MDGELLPPFSHSPGWTQAKKGKGKPSGVGKPILGFPIECSWR